MYVAICRGTRSTTTNLILASSRYSDHDIQPSTSVLARWTLSSAQPHSVGLRSRCRWSLYSSDHSLHAATPIPTAGPSNSNSPFGAGVPSVLGLSVPLQTSGVSRVTVPLPIRSGLNPASRSARSSATSTPQLPGSDFASPSPAVAPHATPSASSASELDGMAGSQQVRRRSPSLAEGSEQSASAKRRKVTLLLGSGRSGRSVSLLHPDSASEVGPESEDGASSRQASPPGRDDAPSSPPGPEGTSSAPMVVPRGRGRGRGRPPGTARGRGAGRGRGGDAASGPSTSRLATRSRKT